MLLGDPAVPSTSSITVPTVPHQAQAPLVTVTTPALSSPVAVSVSDTEHNHSAADISGSSSPTHNIGNSNITNSNITNGNVTNSNSNCINKSIMSNVAPPEPQPTITPTPTPTPKPTPTTTTPASGGSEEGSDDGGKKGSKTGKSRRELPAGAVATLKAWLLSPEHFTHPYPTPQDQVVLMQKTGIDKKQLKNWFTNARRRIWKPMLKKQLEQGKMAQTGTGGVVALPGGTQWWLEGQVIALW